MVIEAPLSIVCWISVILLQAMLHFSLEARKRLNDDSKSSSLDDDDANNNNQAPALMIRHEEVAAVEGPCVGKHDDDPGMKLVRLSSEDDDGDESLDGDEPQIFFRLLSQTGSEMMNVS
jgi:hypothetical protein